MEEILERIREILEAAQDYEGEEQTSSVLEADRAEHSVSPIFDGAELERI